MEAQSSSSDIGLVSPEWLQSDGSFSFDAFGDIDALMADLPDFAATPVRHARGRSLAPRPQDRPCLPTTDGDELQRLQDKNKSKNTKKSTNTWVNRLQRWQEHKGITGRLLDLNVHRVLCSMVAL